MTRTLDNLAGGTQTLRLSDGRQLAWVEYGAPQAPPVFALHGTPGSGRQFYPVHEAATTAGVRLICPDRPGYGGSTTDPRLTFDSFADDLLTLHQHLRLPPVILLGLSGGGGYSLAAAARFGPRASRLLLVSAMAPGVPAHVLTERLRSVSLLVRAATAMPWLARALVSLQLATQHHQSRARPSWSTRVMARSLPEPDRRALLALAASPTGLGSAVRSSGAATVIRELAAYTQPLDLPRLTTPCWIIHGRRDRNVPLAVAGWLADRLGATLVEAPESGHLLMFADPGFVFAQVRTP